MSVLVTGECDGCGEAFDLARMDCRDGDFFCAACLRKIEDEAAEVIAEQHADFYHSRGV